MLLSSGCAPYHGRRGWARDFSRKSQLIRAVIALGGFAAAAKNAIGAQPIDLMIA